MVLCLPIISILVESGLQWLESKSHFLFEIMNILIRVIGMLSSLQIVHTDNNCVSYYLSKFIKYRCLPLNKVSRSCEKYNDWFLILKDITFKLCFCKNFKVRWSLTRLQPWSFIIQGERFKELKHHWELDCFIV